MAETPQPIGVIGLGIIGSRVASNLRDTGHEVFVWSPTPRAVPNFLGSPREVADFAKVVQLFVRDSEALIATVEAMQPALTPEHVIINCATVSPEATRTAADRVQSAAAAFLDCPFTGSKLAAQNAQLVYYVGGNKATLDLVRPLLEVSSREIQHVGEIGHATVLKLVTNMITATTVQILAEALALTESQGISGEKLGRAIELNACNSGVVGLKLQSMIRRDYEPHFSLKNMLKDARYALAMAEELDLELPIHSRTAELMQSAMSGEHPDADFSILFKRFHS